MSNGNQTKFSTHNSISNPPSQSDEIKTLRTQLKINEAIDKLGKDSNAINNTIKAKREAELNIAKTAKEFHSSLLGDIKVDLENRRNNVHQFKDNKKAIATLESDQKKIEEIQEYIATFEQNVTKGVNYKRDKKTDTAYDNVLLMTSPTSNRQGKINIPDEWNRTKKVEVHSLEQLVPRSKQIDVMHKTWKGLSKMKNDDDRSKRYAALSDHIASMATTSLNTTRQAFAMLQALLTYAVVDVVYKGLVEGTFYGLKQGVKTGYKETNDGIKKAANAMYTLKEGTEKTTQEMYNKSSDQYRECYVASIELLHKNDEDFNLDKYTEGFDKASVTEKIKLIALNQRELAKTQTKLTNNNLQAMSGIEGYYSSIEHLEKPNLATKGVAFLGGAVGAVVGGIVNAVWKGITSSVRAVKYSERMKWYYSNIKPKKATSWNKDHWQVQDERSINKMAQSLVKYAEKTVKSGKFTEVEETKAKARGNNSSMKKS